MYACSWRWFIKPLDTWKLSTCMDMFAVSQQTVWQMYSRTSQAGGLHLSTHVVLSLSTTSASLLKKLERLWEVMVDLLICSVICSSSSNQWQGVSGWMILITAKMGMLLLDLWDLTIRTIWSWNSGVKQARLPCGVRCVLRSCCKVSSHYNQTGSEKQHLYTEFLMCAQVYLFLQVEE